MLLGDEFLAYNVLGSSPQSGQHIGILLVELGVGLTVSKVMVEGKDFFDGDSKIASKNIPSSAVDKVQILKN